MLVTALLVIVLALGAGVPVCARGVEWDTLNHEVESLCAQGRYGRAIFVAKKALQVAKQTVGPDYPDVATSLNNLALLYKTQGRYEPAEPLYKRSLAIREKTIGRNHPKVADSLENLAALYRKTGRDTNADVLEKRSAAIRAIKR